MKHVALIIMIILSVFLLGCAKEAPATTDTSDITLVVQNNTPVEPSSGISMPPPPPEEPNPESA